MPQPIDFAKIKHDLINLYKEFIQDPKNKLVQDKIHTYEKEFGDLQIYNEYMKSDPVPKEIELALSGLSAIFQYGMWEEDSESSSNKEVIVKAKEILVELEK